MQTRALSYRTSYARRSPRRATERRRVSLEDFARRRVARTLCVWLSNGTATRVRVDYSCAPTTDTKALTDRPPPPPPAARQSLATSPRRTAPRSRDDAAAAPRATRRRRAPLPAAGAVFPARRFNLRSHDEVTRHEHPLRDAALRQRPVLPEDAAVEYEANETAILGRFRLEVDPVAFGPLREDEIFHRAHRRGRRQRQRSCARRRSEGGGGWARGARSATRARRKEERGGGGGEAQTRGVENRSATTTRECARRSRSRDARTSTSSSSRERASERRGRWIARSRDRRGGKRARTDVDALHHPKPHFHRRHGVRAVASDSDAMPRRLCDLLFRGTTTTPERPR